MPRVITATRILLRSDMNDFCQNKFSLRPISSPSEARARAKNRHLDRFGPYCTVQRPLFAQNGPNAHILFVPWPLTGSRWVGVKIYSDRSHSYRSPKVLRWSLWSVACGILPSQHSIFCQNPRHSDSGLTVQCRGRW